MCVCSSSQPFCCLCLCLCSVCSVCSAQTIFSERQKKMRKTRRQQQQRNSCTKLNYESSVSVLSFLRWVSSSSSPLCCILTQEPYRFVYLYNTSTSHTIPFHFAIHSTLHTPHIAAKNRIIEDKGRREIAVVSLVKAHNCVRKCDEYIP